VIPANAGVRKNGQQLPTRRVGGIWILLNIYFFACGMPLFSNAAWSRLQTGTGIVHENISHAVCLFYLVNPVR